MKRLKYVPFSVPNPDRITVSQTCRLLGISTKTLSGLRREGKLKLKFSKGGSFYFDICEVEAIFNERTNRNTPKP